MTALPSEDQWTEEARTVAKAVVTALADHGGTVDGIERLTGGSSREIWAVEAAIGATARSLIVRRDPPGEVRPGGVHLEAAVMAAARHADVPVPEVLAVLDIGGSSALLMERISGETVPRRILRSEALIEARTGLATELGSAVGRLHQMPTVDGLPYEDRLTSYRAVLDRLEQPRPVLELAHRWLIEHRPVKRAPVVVHGDFRLGNMVVDGRGLRAVLDWESAHVGDPLEDLGWLCVPAWRFRGEGVVAGVGDADVLLDAYAATGAPSVTPDELRWAIVYGTWVWAVGCLEQAERHRSGSQRSVDLATVGRRVVENEADLLDLLAEPDRARSEPAPPPTPARVRRAATGPLPYGPPSLVELVDAVRGSLESEVLPASFGRARYLLQVSINALGMVEREIQHHLPDIDIETDATLAARLRRGAAPDLRVELPGLVHRTADRLDVTDPARAQRLRATHLQ